MPRFAEISEILNVIHNGNVICLSRSSHSRKFWLLLFWTSCCVYRPMHFKVSSQQLRLATVNDCRGTTELLKSEVKLLNYFRNSCTDRWRSASRHHSSNCRSALWNGSSAVRFSPNIQNSIQTSNPAIHMSVHDQCQEEPTVACLSFIVFKGSALRHVAERFLSFFCLWTQLCAMCATLWEGQDVCILARRSNCCHCTGTICALYSSLDPYTLWHSLQNFRHWQADPGCSNIRALYFCNTGPKQAIT